jgi:predicted metal-dependent hydrolase
MTPVIPPQAFWQGVEQFNRQDFYACHDTLEALWMEALSPQKRFYQGVLQIAVACYHLGNLNWRGAVILLGEGIGRLGDYQPVYEGIDVEALILESRDLLRALQQSGQEQVADFVQQLAQSEVSGLPTIKRVFDTNASSIQPDNC